nr:TPA_asm: P7-6 protein [Grapevine associated jivivirus 1]
MSSVTDSQISNIAHPVLCNFDVQYLLSSGCSEKLIFELIQYNKSTYQAYVSVVHAVTNPGGSSRSGSGNLSSRSSLLSSPTGSYRTPSPVNRAANLPSRKFSGARGFGSASLVRPSNYFSDRIQCASVSAKEGFCYTKLFRSSRVDDVASVLGPWPALESILAHPVRDFRALSSMGALSLYDSDLGYHLDVSGLGLGGLPVVDVMKTLAEGVMFPAGSMGKEMSRSSGSLLDGCGVMLSSRIGGSSSRHELTRVDGEDDGFCYLRIFNSDFHQDVKRGLGSYPSLAAISRVPANVRLSELILSKLWLVQRGQCLHVEDQPFEDANTVFRVLKLVDGFVLPEYTQTWTSMRVGGRDRLVMENTSPFLGEFDPFASPDYDDGFPRVGGKGDRLSLRREVFVPRASKGMPLVRLDLRGTVSVGVSAGCSVPFSLPLNSVVELGKECYGHPVVCADGYEGMLVWNSVERICELYDDSNFDYLRDFCNF